MQAKRPPQRMCTGCKTHRPKKELIRVVRDPQGGISLDLTGRKSGRGAYLCPDAACLRLARKAKRLERSLECAVPDEVYAALEEELSKLETP